jgi:pilus assembly protein CpaB
MKPARIILLVVALIAGGLAAFLATRNNAPAPTPTATTTVTEVIEEPRGQVLVASAPIGIGQRLSPDVVEWQDWPVGAIRPEYISIAALPDAPEQLTDAVARFEFFPGEPILEAKLVRTDQGYLSAVAWHARRLDQRQRRIGLWRLHHSQRPR